MNGVLNIFRPRLHGKCFFGENSLAMSLYSQTAKISLIYYLARSPLSQIFDNKTSPQN